MKTFWFKRLEKDIHNLSSNIRLVRGRNGFYRVYFKNAYLHEVFEELPQQGYDFEDYDPRFESQDYYEEFEYVDDLIRKVKNYKEGYWDAIGTIKRRFWLLRNNLDFYNEATGLYKDMVVK